MSPSTCDVQPIYSCFGDDPDLGELVEMFVEEMPERIATLLEQFNSRQWDALRRTAHQIKGAAGSYGFDAITPDAARLENALRENEPEDRLREAVDALVNMCGRARAGTPG